MSPCLRLHPNSWQTSHLQAKRYLFPLRSCIFHSCCLASADWMLWCGNGEHGLNRLLLLLLLLLSMFKISDAAHAAAYARAAVVCSSCRRCSCCCTVCMVMLLLLPFLLLRMLRLLWCVLQLFRAPRGRIQPLSPTGQDLPCQLAGHAWKIAWLPLWLRVWT